jgi:hypothetical protein
MRIHKPDPEIEYSEIQFSPIWHALLSLLVTSSLGIAYASAVSGIWGLLIGIILSTIAIWWWIVKSVQISITNDLLVIGKYEIERKYIAKVSSLNSDEFLQRIRGGAHRQDVFVLRNLKNGGLEIEIKDDRDPFCHWVVSAKRPSRIATLLSVRG